MGEGARGGWEGDVHGVLPEQLDAYNAPARKREREVAAATMDHAKRVHAAAARSCGC